MGIPKPLVQVNQIFIISTVIISFLTNEAILLIPFVVGLITLAVKRNPIMMIGKKFLKKSHNQYVLEDQEQQIFNQWIATICLGLSLLFHSIGNSLLGSAFSIMVAIAAGLALMGYCIGCTIRFRYKMWKYKRRSA